MKEMRDRRKNIRDWKEKMKVAKEKNSFPLGHKP
jgi:hypothetical protein